MRHPAKLLSLATLAALFTTFDVVADQRPNQRSGFAEETQSLQQTPLHFAQADDRKAEADRLYQQGLEQYNTSQFQAALESWQSALDLYQDPEVQAAFPQESRREEGNTLRRLGNVYFTQAQYDQATGFYEQALSIARGISDRQGEGRAVNNLGNISRILGRHEQAVNFYRQALEIARGIGDRQGEGNALNNLGLAYRNFGQYEEAIVLYEQVLMIAREIGDRRGEGNALGNLGNAYANLGQYEEAIAFHEQSLVIAREIGDRRGEGNALGNLGIAYRNLGQYEEAVALYEQELIIRFEIGDRRGEGAVLGSLGIVYRNFGQYEKAIAFYEQQLVITREIGDRQGEGNALDGLGLTHSQLGRYEEAIAFHEQSLVISREIGNRRGEGIVLGNLGIAYHSLGQYEEAIALYEQQLVITREIGDRRGEGNALGNLGNAYRNFGQYEEAIVLYEQYLAIAHEIGNRRGEGSALGSLGNTYFSFGQYEEAIALYEQVLMIAREIGDQRGEGVALGNLGNAYRNLGQSEEALEQYRQAVTLLNQVGVRSDEAAFLSNIGRLLNRQDQPELAIVFLKASVEVRESIRGDIRGLDTDLQQSFTDTIADDYRLLADLLLEQGRIPEAQQVLDLLKLEELREFTNTRAMWDGEALQYTAAEQPVIAAHDSLIALGSAILTCEADDCSELDDLYDQRDALTAQYNDQVEQFAETIRANRRDDSVFQDPDQLSDEAKTLLSAYAAEGQTPVLIYPFVLEDKLWLVWAIEGRVIGSAEVPVSQGELSTAVQRFGELLTDRGSLADLQAQGQQLYDWIINPTAAELEANGIDHLIFVNDRVTRYIPMAALYDGEQFLIERFQISTVLTPGLTNTRDRLGTIDQSPVLGLGLSNSVAGFNPLPAVDAELDAIVRSDDNDVVGIYPGQVLLNDDFTFDALKTNVRNHQVLHLATHAAFVPGRADESFIVLGDGDRLTTGDIDDISARLDNLHLVILSACETALGGADGDGTEIAGISSYFLGASNSRADTVIASLWAVNDDSTSLLMQRFYEFLSTGEFTKAEALRQAQLSLLYDEDTETRLEAARTATVELETRDGRPLGTTGLEHPYHWAPFILIGNGL